MLVDGNSTHALQNCKRSDPLYDDRGKQVQHQNAVEHHECAKESCSDKVVLSTAACSQVAVGGLHSEVPDQPCPVIVCCHSSENKQCVSKVLKVGVRAQVAPAKPVAGSVLELPLIPATGPADTKTAEHPVSGGKQDRQGVTVMALTSRCATKTRSGKPVHTSRN